MKHIQQGFADPACFQLRHHHEEWLPDQRFPAFANDGQAGIVRRFYQQAFPCQYEDAYWCVPDEVVCIEVNMCVGLQCRGIYKLGKIRNQKRLFKGTEIVKTISMFWNI